MLPMDYQEEILKIGSGDRKLEYENVKNYVLSWAQQRASSMHPKPSDVIGMDTPNEGADQSGAVEGKYSSEEWMQWMWENDIGAAGSPNIQCWVCGALGHIGRNCPSKGK
eukprot:5883934-Karenia_brevis.AAC.1